MSTPSTGTCGEDGTCVRLGIFGGTFDPIHFGHLSAAEQVREQLNLSKVIFVPTGEPVFKKDAEVSPAHDRLAMLRLATASNPYFEVSSMEIDRQGLTYTIDTLRELRNSYPATVSFFFITGADAMVTIPQWKDADQFFRYARFVAITRPGHPIDEAEKAQLRDCSLSVEYLEVPAFQISSSFIREQASQGRSIRYVTPEPVQDYIADHKLYAPFASAKTR